MKTIFFIPFILLAASSLSGCLVSEVTEYRITLNRNGSGGSFTTVMRNVESDSPDSTIQQQDFQTLISRWKGDHFLFEEMDKGLYVKERKLRLEKGKLVWSETAIFSDLTKMIPEYDPEQPLRFPLTDTSGQHVVTNGKITSVSDSLYIIWAPHTKMFELKISHRTFMPTSHFPKRFRTYAGK